MLAYFQVPQSLKCSILGSSKNTHPGTETQKTRHLRVERLTRVINSYVDYFIFPKNQKYTLPNVQYIPAPHIGVNNPPISLENMNIFDMFEKP